MPAAAAPLLLVLALLAGCNPATAFVERAVERELPDLIGPADAYDVSIEGLRLGEGAAEQVDVTGLRVRPDGAPVLDRLALVLTGVRYDPDAGRLDHVESARATAHVRPSDLAAFLDAHRNVRDAALTLRPPDGATLRFRPEIRGFTVPEGVAVALTGRLAADDGRVRFEVSEVRAGGLPLGRLVAQQLSAAINPVVDLTGTGAALHVTRVTVSAASIRVEATGDPTGL